jgi:hypothetical protein
MWPCWHRFGVAGSTPCGSAAALLLVLLPMLLPMLLVQLSSPVLIDILNVHARAYALKVKRAVVLAIKVVCVH